MKTLIAGGRVVDPAQALDALRDVLIENGRIAEIGEHLDGGEAERIDASGCIVAPGFIDMHAHLRDPGQTRKETLETGSAAAVAGGFTAVCAMPNTEPALDTPTLVAEIRRRAEEVGYARVYPIGAITRGRAGKELAPYHLLAQSGAVAFSDDGTTVANARVLREAARYASDLDAPFISHCEDADLKGEGVINEGTSSIRLGLAGSPGLAEDIIVARDLLIAGDVGKRWHIAHLSTRRSLELIRFARSRGIAATCEVTPHHLLLADDRFDDYRADGKVNPPLRTSDDASALCEAVRDGTVDVLATDHAPHGLDEKAQLLSLAPVGFSGLEIAVGAYARALEGLDLTRFIALLSTNPARILGVEGGRLHPGSPADVTIFADRAWQVEARRFYSKGRNTPFDGWTFPRSIIATIVDGDVVYAHGSVRRRRVAVTS